MWFLGIVGSPAKRMDEMSVATMVDKADVADGG